VPMRIKFLKRDRRSDPHAKEITAERAPAGTPRNAKWTEKQHGD
jgi:hypothetical protein